MRPARSGLRNKKGQTMYQTKYVKAASTEEAVSHMSADGQLLAGGMTLIPTMKQRLASPEKLVDLGAILCSCWGVLGPSWLQVEAFGTISASS